MKQWENIENSRKSLWWMNSLAEFHEINLILLNEMKGNEWIKDLMNHSIKKLNWNENEI